MTDTRACFESKLAAQILENPGMFPAVEKLSGLILNLLHHPDNQAFLSVKQVINDETIRQLYSNTHYGTLGGELMDCPTQAIFIRAIIEALSGPHSDLPKILHIHQIFMQAIYSRSGRQRF